LPAIRSSLTFGLDDIAVLEDMMQQRHNHLIGIDPDGRVHVSDRLLMLHDGPLLEQSLKACAGALIRPPKGKQLAPTATGSPPGSSSSSPPGTAPIDGGLVLKLGSSADRHRPALG
jgi:hypothetical protein